MKKIYETPTFSVVEIGDMDIVTYSKPNDDAIITEDDNWANAFMN